MEEKKTKRCCKCKKELPVEEFHKNKSSKDGLNSICKKCKSVYWHQKKDGTVIGTPLPTVLNKRKKPIRQILAGPPVCHLKTEIEKNPITRATPEEIVRALTKGVAEQIIQIIRERFSL